MESLQSINSARPDSGRADCEKASQSLPPAGGKEIKIIFWWGVYLTEKKAEIIFP